MSRNRIGGGVAFALLTLAGAGCGGGPTPVEGVVLLDGRPLEGATINFVPDGGVGEPAVAVTTADGRFQASTQAGLGAMPNTYRVLISKVTGPPQRRPPWAGRAEAPTEAEKAAYLRELAAIDKAQKDAVPPDYTRANTTPLRVTVPLKGELRIEMASPTGGGQAKP
jgi:hypothetical protein